MADSSLMGRFFKRIHPESIPWPGSVLYNLISSTVIFQRHYEMVTEDILQYCKKGSLLDIGTGPARLLLKIHQKAPQMRLVGIDSSPAMVTKAKENITGVESIEIKEGSAASIPFPDKCFDIVVSTASIHHWKAPAKGLNEVYRVLKNNGFALIYDLVSDTPQSVLDDCRRQFGKLKTTLFWLHSFEEPFYTQENFKALAGQSLFKDCRTKFLGLLYCLIMEKKQTLNRKELNMTEEIIGKVSDFFAHPVVAGIELTGPLKVGDKIKIKGHTTELEITVGIIQINNANVAEAKAGDSIGIKVTDRVRKGDNVYKITE